MTLQERFEKALSSTVRAHELEKHKAAAEKMEEKTNQLREHRQTLDQDRARHDALRRHGFPVSWPDASKVRLALTAYAAAFAKEPTGGASEFGKVAKTLAKFVEDFTATIATVVATHSKEFQKDAAALKSLKDVEGLKQKVADAQRDVDKLLAQDWKRADGPTLEGILKQRKALLERIEPLVRADVPEDVRRFFTAARGDGASLKLFTDAVQEWLKKNDHIDKVRMVVK